MIIVKTDYETAKEFENYRVRTVYEKKKHQVLFKVYCDDSSIDACLELCKSANSNILFLEYQGDLDSIRDKNMLGVYIGKKYEVGNDVNEEDIKGVSEDLPDGVTGIIVLPQEYNDMRFLYDMSEKYTNIRFCGGTVFCFDGCRLGCCGRDILDAKGVKFDKDEYVKVGCSCAAQVVEDTEVELEKGTEYKKPSNTQPKSSKPKKLSNKQKTRSLVESFGHFEL